MVRVNNCLTAVVNHFGELVRHTHAYIIGDTIHIKCAQTLFTSQSQCNMKIVVIILSFEFEVYMWYTYTSTS